MAEETNSGVSTSQPSGGASSGNDPFAAANAAATEVRRGRGRPPGSGKKTEEETPEDRIARLAKQSKLLEKLYRSENWRRFASMYFDARFAITGFDGFQLTTEERDELADTISLMVQVVFTIDPKYLVIFMFVANFGGTIAAKEIAYANARTQGK